jgi:NAD(P)-dependent dehydrogenase (short-subunit alcohol dehydrogenase family)
MGSRLGEKLVEYDRPYSISRRGLWLMSEPARGVCLVIGAGDGLGASIARAFAREGLGVCVTRRPRHTDPIDTLAESIRAEGGKAYSFGLDARVEADVAALVERIEREVGSIEVLVFNIGANVRFPVVETTTQVYSKVWEMAALAGFLTSREAARAMIERGRGTILFTGATASVRGGAGFSAFAGAKHALRALAQSLARELGPRGVHVAHIVIDGAIDGAFIRGLYPDAAEKLARDEILSPDEIARNYVWLHNQKRGAWTFEMDLRPWKETW